MSIHIVGVFPEMVESFLQKGVVGYATKKGRLGVKFYKLKEFTYDKHNRTDQRPIGGGPGMVIKFEPVFAALYSILGNDILDLFNRNRLIHLTEKLQALHRKSEHLEGAIGQTELEKPETERISETKKRQKYLRQLISAKANLDMQIRKTTEWINTFTPVDPTTLTSELSHLSPIKSGNRSESKRKFRVILLDASGKQFTAKRADKLSSFVNPEHRKEQNELIILCGRYQGFDERINLLSHEKLKVGSAILSGGEIAATYILDAVIRLLPDVLHNQESKSVETFDRKNYPLFTKPIHLFDPHLHPDLSVSDTLLSGNHQSIHKERYGIGS